MTLKSNKSKDHVKNRLSTGFPYDTVFFMSQPLREARLNPRTPVHAQIVFKIPIQKGKYKVLTLYSENISEGGVFLKSTTRKLPFSVGTIVDLHFSLPINPILIRTKGKIVWTTEGWSENLEGINGLGVQFIDMKEEFREVIRRFVAENVDVEA